MGQGFDPWVDNSSLALLAQVSDSAARNRIAQQEMALRAQAQSRQDQLFNMQMEEYQRQNEARQAAMDAYNGARPQTLASIAQPEPTFNVIPGGQYLQGIGAGVYDRQALETAIKEAQGNAAQSPWMAQQGGLNNRIAGMQQSLATLATPQAPAPAEFSLDNQTSPLVQAYKDNRISFQTIPADKYGAAAEEYRKRGMFSEADALQKSKLEGISLDQKLAEAEAEMQLNGGDPRQAAAARVQLGHFKELVSTVVPLLKTSAGRVYAQKYLDAAKQAYPNSPMFQNAKLSDFAETPQGPAMTVYDDRGQRVGYYAYDPGKGEMAYHEAKSETVNDFNTFFEGFAYQHPELSGGQLKAAANKAWHDQKMRENEAMGNSRFGGMFTVVPGAFDENGTPIMASRKTGAISSAKNPQGVNVAAAQSDYKALSGSLSQQEKQVGAMGSFVKNIDKQVQRVKDISQELSSFDTRLLNIPLRAVRGRIAGSPQQAKYDMYLTEIESEIGKLATGSSGSVAELSQEAQKKWARIHDKNLSINDMLSLLEETSHAGRLRMESVTQQAGETRARIKGNAPTGQTSGGRFTIIGVKK